MDRPDFLVRFGRQKREDIVCGLAFLYFPDRGPAGSDTRKKGQWPGIVEGEPNRRTGAVPYFLAFANVIIDLFVRVG